MHRGLFVVVIVVLGGWLAATGAGARADMGASDWRVRGALAALESGEPALAPPAIRVLAELGATFAFERIVAHGKQHLDDAAEREALAHALGKLQLEPERSLPLLVELFLIARSTSSEACEAFRSWRDSPQAASLAARPELALRPDVDALDWFYCVGIWNQAGVDQWLAAFGSGSPYLAEEVVPHERAATARKLLDRLGRGAAKERIAALGLLGRLGYSDAEVTGPIERVAKETKDAGLRAAATEALARLRAPTPPSPNPPDAVAAARLRLERTPPGAARSALLLELLSEELHPALVPVVLASPLPAQEALALIERTYDAGVHTDPLALNQLRAWAIILSGGEPSVVLAARWLANNSKRPPRAQLPSALAVRELLKVVPAPKLDKTGLTVSASGSSDVQEGAFALLQRIIESAGWTSADEPMLRELLALIPDDPQYAELRAELQRRIDSLAPTAAPLLPRIGSWLVAAFGAHFLIWLGLLLTIYPRSRTVQAAMLFNPLGRAVTGWGYTQLLVLVSPRLRRRLFHPLVDADRDTEVVSYDSASFCDQIRVAPLRPGKNPQAPVEVLPPISWERLAAMPGLIVIEGASGLGKTHVAKALLERARAAGRTCLFVRAAECNGGVIKELEDRLALGHSSGFVHSMIHRGAIELFIDGLNEALPAGVAEIAQFCERATHARIVITTQPMTWACPRRGRQFRLLPLEPGELEAFLIAQWPAVRVTPPDDGAVTTASAAAAGAPAAAPASPAAAAAAAADEDPARVAYLARIRAFLAGRASPRELAVLQSRIDLAFVAHLLAREQIPNIHSLRKQVVDDAARAYEDASPGGAFPLAALAAAALHVLQIGNPLLELDGVDPDVLEQLAERKLLLRRGAGEWLFRHDTITCYFAAAGFFAPRIGADAVDPQVVTSAHLSSPRFVGVYLQLAESLPLSAARTLAAALREHGRVTGDRTLEIAYQDLVDHRPDVAPAEVAPADVTPADAS